MGRWPSYQSPMGEMSPHKNKSQQKSFSNPEQEVQKGIKMLEKSHLEQRLLSHTGRQPLCGTGPAQGLGTSQPSFGVHRDPHRRQKNFVSSIAATSSSSLIPTFETQMCQEPSLAAFKSMCLLRSHTGCFKGRDGVVGFTI